MDKPKFELDRHIFSQSAVLILGILLLVVFICTLLGSLVAVGLSQMWDVPLEEWLRGDVPITTAKERNRMRLLFVVNQFTTFLLPGLLAGWLIYRTQLWHGLRLANRPHMQWILMGLVWLVVSWPFIIGSYSLNQLWELPDWLAASTDTINAQLELLLTTHTTSEFLLNVFLIGILPALGEEIIFRAFLQRQAHRLLGNGHVAVWLTAIIFSAIHMQFEGFLPRMLLGAILGYLFYWTRNLWVPVAVHFLNNTLQLIAYKASWISQEVASDETMEEMPIWSVFVSFLLSIAIAAYWQHQVKLESQNTIS